MLGTSAYLDPILVNKYFNNTEITFEDLHLFSFQTPIL
jgi:hypothetical protein